MKRETMKLAAIFMTVILVCGLLVGCAASTEEETKQAASAAPEETSSGKTYVNIGVPASVTTLDPFTSDVGFSGVMPVYEYLCSWDQFGSEGNFVGVGAKNWECISEDGCTYQIELYDNIYDSLGNHITSSDIVFWYEKAYEASNDAAMNLTGAPEIINDYTFTITLVANRIGLFESVTGMMALVSQKSYESNNYAEMPITTGQYQVTHFVPGSSLRFELRDDYWQKDSEKIMYDTNVDIINYSFITEAAQLAIALETGDIDIAVNLSTIEAERFMEGGSEAGSYSVHSVNGHVVFCLLPNMSSSSVFSGNLALRQAVFTAINSEDVMYSAIDGYGTVLTRFSSPCYPDWQKEWDNNEYFSFDPDAAKQLLEEAGYSEGELSLTILTSNSGVNQNIAQVVQSELRNIGIECTINAVDNGIWDSAKRDEAGWDLIVETKGDSVYGINVSRVCFDMEQNGGTTCNFLVDDELQSLLDACIMNGEEGHNAENMTAFYDYLDDNAYAYALFTTQSFFVGKNGIEIFTDSSDAVIGGNCTYSDAFLAEHIVKD